ncbi:MAG: 30S ribosomal protein S16 [Chitinophagaceae bacterium]
MPVKIRLQRQGAKKRPFFSIIIADSKAPRDGKFIEKIGTYNPLTNPATIQIDEQKALRWIENGAQPTKTVKGILSYKGVLYFKHLLHGVKLGLFERSVAIQKFSEWKKKHDIDVLENIKKVKDKKQEAQKAVWDFSVDTKKQKIKTANELTEKVVPIIASEAPKE